MKIQSVAVADLCLDPANVRQHGDRSLAAIRGSLSRFGQQKPIVVDGNGVVRAGNGTLMAAKDLGWESIDVVHTDLSSSELAAFAIADNRSAELSDWDEGALTAVLAALKEDGIHEDALGFSAEDVVSMRRASDGDGGEQVEDPGAGAVPENPVTRTTDLWLLGDHMIICGDSTSAEDVGKLFGDEVADLLLTDPPYGVSYKGKTADALEVVNDDLDEKQLSSLVDSAFGLAEVYTRPGAYWYATVPAVPLHLLFALDWKRRGVLRQILVWAKDTLVMGHSEYHYQHEPILFGWRPGGKRLQNADRTRTTLWSYARPKASREHPTMKPLPLWEQAVRDGSAPGDLIYDPFLGSGTTLLASESLRRSCRGLEISPAYCDVIVRRWEAATGKEGTLESTGRTFSEVERERLDRS